MFYAKTMKNFLFGKKDTQGNKDREHTNPVIQASTLTWLGCLGVQVLRTMKAGYNKDATKCVYHLYLTGKTLLSGYAVAHEEHKTTNTRKYLTAAALATPMIPYFFSNQPQTPDVVDKISENMPATVLSLKMIM